MYQKWYKKQAFSCDKTWTKHGQKTLLFYDNNRVKTVSKTGIMVQAKDHQNASNFGGVSMATSWESVDVGCPFYKASDELFIRCEGIAGVSVTMIFTGRREKTALMERYCKSQCEACPLHKAIVAKYE